MAEATQEMIALAWEIVNDNSNYMQGLDRGQCNFSAQEAIQIALAAIQATTERAAKLADGWLGVDYDESANCMAANIRDDLLAAAHLKEQSA